ncbi:MAG: alpha/beta hydrolase [Anaerolineales bacterium]
MKKFVFLLLILMLFASACAPQADSPVLKRSMNLQPCPLKVGQDNQVQALCGTLPVPENPNDPQGRTISLNVVVLPAVKRIPEPDALFLLAGGPGQAATEAFPALLAAFFTIHQTRDIVMVDQRGTGKSNPLRCLDDEDESLAEDAALEKLKACPAALDADLRYYTTEIAMADLDAVRAALGYETINLYGASYGTRAALTYLRLYPDRVRSLILDAVVDPSFILLLDSAHDGQAALDQFFARCQADAACREAFPSLRSDFDTLLVRLEKEPVELSIRHPITAQPLDLTLTRSLLLDLVFSILYSPDLSATLPLTLRTAYQEGNYAPLVSLAYMLDVGLYDGMFYAVTCTEDAPLIQPEEAARRSAGTLFGDRTAQFLSVCADWPRGQVSADFRAPIRSDVPVLIFSGEADPITPPRHAERLLEGLPNSLHLVFDESGHGNIANRCSAGIVEAFVKSASIEGLDVACVPGVRPAPFFTNFNGPRP